MKNKKIRRISIVMSLLLLFNSLGMFASDSVSQDEVLDSSFTEQTENIVLNSANPQAIMGKYYSDYDEAAYYDSVDELQKRANCYGYAFRMFYSNNAFPTGVYNYKQQPGEFAQKSQSNPLRIYEGIGAYAGDEVGTITARSSLVDFYNYKLYPASSEFRMSYLKQLIEADATTLGYTVSEYTGTTIPNATTYTNRRLIAVVVAPTDYHFYIQHSDNTWSHKRGTLVPQSDCISCHLELTNENIRAHACEGTYSEGMVKFFYITKNAITDFKHDDGSASSVTYTTPTYTDLAGSNRFAAQDISGSQESYMEGEIDYPGDTDYYGFYSSDTGTFTVWVQSSSNYSLQIRVHDSSGALVASRTATSESSVSVNLEIDRQYYIAITSLNYSSYNYGFDYQFGIQQQQQQ